MNQFRKGIIRGIRSEQSDVATLFPSVNMAHPETPRSSTGSTNTTRFNVPSLRRGGFGASIADDERPVRINHVVLGSDGKPVTIEEEPVGRVQAYTLGVERELPIGTSWLNFEVGAQVTAYGMPANLKAVYGSPSTFVMFPRLRSAGNMTDHMKQMHR